VKNHKSALAILICSMLSSVAQADVKQAADDVKDTAVHVARKTGEVAREAAHATAHAAKSVAHDVAGGARKGYRATKKVVARST
jgi:hypothetical protein